MGKAMKQRRFGRNEGDSPKGKFYLLPSLLTTFSLFSGFYAIISAINGSFFNSAVAILIAAVFDGLDGRVARLTGTTSRFGMEYDSLCDLVAFGVTPALLSYLWILKPYGRYGWLAAFLYVATTALRLARFNAVDVKDSQKSFTGLPCPAAACMIATSLMFFLFLEENGSTGTVAMLDAVRDGAMLVLVYTLSFLMVSSFAYLSFKHPETTKAKTFQVLVGMVLLIMVVATVPQVTLFCLGLIYVCSGPFYRVYELVRRQRKPVSCEKMTH